MTPVSWDEQREEGVSKDGGALPTHHSSTLILPIGRTLAPCAFMCIHTLPKKAGACSHPPAPLMVRAPPKVKGGVKGEGGEEEKGGEGKMKERRRTRGRKRGRGGGEEGSL